jgi:sterol 14alpha-demethylase
MTRLLILILFPLLPALYFLFKPPRIPKVPNATPHFPVIGNAISFGIDPIKFLLSQRARLGDVFLVDLAIIRIVFFLGPDGTNAILKGTERSGISFWEAVVFIFGESARRGKRLLTGDH